MKHAADIVKGMLAKPYKLGSSGEAFDCLSFMLNFYEERGIKWPTEWRGWTRENYAELWKDGYGRTELYEFLKELGEEVDINFMLEGDLIIIDAGEAAIPAIYLSSGSAMLVIYERGVMVVPLWSIQDKIVEVRRLGR